MSAKPLAYAQLLRLPNVFTAIADPLAGWFVVGGGAPAWHIVLLLLASAGLYTGGIVLNDCFDYRLDLQERPERPLPRGALARPTGWVLGFGLLAGGLAAAALVSPVTLGIAGGIAGMILFYNTAAKHHALLGPLVLGVCRFGNFLLGMRCCPPRLWIAPAILGLYVAILTYIARREVIDPAVRLVVKRLLLGIIALDAALVVAFSGDWVGAAWVLSLLVPAYILSKLIPMT